MITANFSEATSDEDYEICARITSAQEPDAPTTGALIRESEVVVPPGTPAFREIMECEGRPVGHVRAIQMFWGDSPGTFETRCACAPDDDAFFPIGQARAMELAIQAGAETLSTWSDERFPDRLKWLTDQGFSETQRNPVSFLNLATFDAERWRPHAERLNDLGIVVRTCHDLIEEKGDEAVRQFWELDEKIMKDVPLPYEWKGIPFPEYQQMVETERRHWKNFLFAMDGDEIVGLTQLFYNEVDASLAGTGLTGVVRSHRRKGIAAGLKVMSLTQAQADNVRRIGTDNEQNNPMYELNIALGFRAEYESIGFERPAR